MRLIFESATIHLVFFLLEGLATSQMGDSRNETHGSSARDNHVANSPTMMLVELNSLAKHL